MRYIKPNIICYRIAQAAAWLVATLVFRRKLLRNEIRGKKGPFVVIANHQTALDFVNLIGATGRPMSFVISNSFYNTLPIKGFLKKMGVIPKQQFQTTVDDLKRIMAVVNNGQPVVIYPAGLMCEDGLSTPIPTATYKFLKWLRADVYVAKARGTYFVMPKWAKGMRPGRTYMDIYKLFSAEELSQLDVEAIRKKTDAALLFDTYREQDVLPVRYRNNQNIAGLENVLYTCPHCRKEFSIRQTDRSTLQCGCCGYAQTSDRYAFLHKTGAVGQEIRYVSDWSRLVYNDLKKRMESGDETELSCRATIRMIDEKKHKFVDVGAGTVTLTQKGFAIAGQIQGADVDIFAPIAGIPTLPFSPGKHFEVQQGRTIYRCVPEDGRLVMKYINMVKIFFELSRRAALPAQGAEAMRASAQQ